MESMDIQKRIIELEQEIAQLPKGSISKKAIGGRNYYYHRLNLDGKRKEEYVPADEVEALRKKIEQRKAFEAELRHLKKIVPTPKSYASQHNLLPMCRQGNRSTPTPPPSGITKSVNAMMSSIITSTGIYAIKCLSFMGCAARVKPRLSGKFCSTWQTTI